MAKPKVCVECGNPPPEGSKLNRRGYCYLCSYEHVKTAAQQLHAHSGPIYDKWKSRMEAAVRGL
jgi:hypothetical protein